MFILDRILLNGTTNIDRIPESMLHYCVEDIERCRYAIVEEMAKLYENPTAVHILTGALSGLKKRQKMLISRMQQYPQGYNPLTLQKEAIRKPIPQVPKVRY